MITDQQTGFSWRRVMSLYLPYSRKCCAIIALISLAAAVNSVSPLLARVIIDQAFPSRNSQLLLICVAGMIAFSTIVAVLTLFEGWLSVDVGEGILRDLREALMRNLSAVSMAFFRRTKQGTIVNRLVADVDNIEDSAIMALSSATKQGIAFIFSFVMMTVIDWRLTCAALIVLVGNIWLSRSAAVRQYEARRRTREMRDEIENLTQEALSYSGVALMKAYNQESSEQRRHARATQGLYESEIELALSGRTVMAQVMLVRFFSLAAVLLAGSLLVLNGSETLGSLVAFLVYLTTFQVSTENSTALRVQLGATRSLYERIFDFLDEPVDIAERVEELPHGPLRVSLFDVRVGFDAINSVVKISSLDIAAGETVAIVGASGAGKSTLVNALLRLIDLQSGTIRIGGTDLQDISETSLRDAVCVVPQEPIIFNASLRDNVAYGTTAYNDEEISRALVAASLGPFVNALPGGLDEMLGEAGSSISAGERQRVSIARALLKSPGLLIYDEATSALDVQAEANIIESIIKSHGERTNIIVAHRYSTVERCDRVVVLERGEVAEIGSVRELLELNGIFANQYWTQFVASAS